MTNQLTPEQLQSVKRVAEACGCKLADYYFFRGDERVDGLRCFFPKCSHGVTVDDTDSLILFLHRCYPVLRERGVWPMFTERVTPHIYKGLDGKWFYEALTNPIGQLKAIEEVLT